MSIQRSPRGVAPFSVLFIFFSCFSIHAQETLPPRPDYVDALWVAQSDGILKLATADATLLLEIADAQNVRAIATDEQRGVLWAYGQNALRAYGFDGELLLSTGATG